ncbi:hypothetical protein B2H91_19725 [Clostridium botulinum]|uniref:helix-turn-helix domain-containing protein n=1 Tax=Clostridium botulinum TaxID=1491 RepID=UPI000A17709D|nr:helix-turn-helix domain-containing protein [Clostridium botulinum]AUN16102.1 hypothetical protein B2M06_00140 [Clostridium botulinum]AUN16123.1 hypothetical protein B2M06_00245 [Clostridium botulinum]MBN3399576.1 hypothetical protein [Clostridium botulinum]OSA82896.1 hypothetical protein B2H91_19725 [Clostridium botulinum]
MKKYEYLAENIKKYRNKLGLTQKQLGEKIYKSEILIRKYESGKTNVPPSTLFDLCNVLDVEIAPLLGDDYKNYYIDNFGQTPEEYIEIRQKDLNMSEKALNIAEQYKKYGDSWHDEVFRIENLPDHLLNSILNYLENTEKYYSPLFVNLHSDDDDTIPYLTTEQVNDIINKVTELVKYEIYKLENNK